MQNRATLSKPERYGWVHAIAACYVIAVGMFSVLAWCNDGQYLRAVMCAGAQALAIVCAVLARRAFTGEMPLMGWLMVAFTLGCAYWSALGIAHAWGDSAEWTMVAFLAALEPLLFLAAEHIKEGREALREHARKEDERIAEELARNRQNDNRWMPRLATAGGVTLGALPAVANASELQVHSPSHIERPAIVSINTGYETAREHAIALKRANPLLKEKQAAQVLGVSRATVGNWWRKERLTVTTSAA